MFTEFKIFVKILHKILKFYLKDELVELKTGGDDTLHLANDSMLWTPDLYIYNLKSINIRYTPRCE